MLGKLMKHEFKAIGRILPLLYVAWIFFSILLSIDIRFFIEGTLIGEILRTIFGSMYVILSIATAVVTLVIVIERFRKNLLCDEGYYMLTLPVSMETHITAKLLSSVIWGFFTGIVGLITFTIIAIITSDVGIFYDILNAIKSITELPAKELASSVIIIIEVIILMLLSIATTVIKIFAALALGKISKKHPNLMAVAFYLGIGFIESTIFSILMVIGTPIGWDIGRWIQDLVDLNIFLLLCIIISVAVFAIYFIITDVVMKRKLDI